MTSTARRVSATEDNKCPICSQDITDKCRIETCGHQFCFECLYNWTHDCSTHTDTPAMASCPVCQRVFTFIHYRIQSDTEFSRHSIHSFPLYGKITAEATRAHNSFGHRVQQLARLKHQLDIISDVRTSRVHVINELLQDIRGELFDNQSADEMVATPSRVDSNGTAVVRCVSQVCAGLDFRLSFVFKLMALIVGFMTAVVASGVSHSWSAVKLFTKLVFRVSIVLAVGLAFQSMLKSQVSGCV